jgi:hypothetical protein
MYPTSFKFYTSAPEGFILHAQPLSDPWHRHEVIDCFEAQCPLGIRSMVIYLGHSLGPEPRFRGYSPRSTTVLH